MSKDFVHLHNHSDYSLLDGAQKIKPMVQKVKALGMQSIALTDHGNLFGAMEFYSYCKKEGIKPIIGMEAYIIGRGSRLNREKVSGIENKVYHIVLLSKNIQGYKNLMKLSTLSYLEGFYYRPRMDKEILRKYSEGLIGLSACFGGEITNLHLQGMDDEAQKAAEEYVDIFGEKNFFFEIQRHGMEQDHAYEKNLILAQKMDISYVATNDVHYTEKDHWEAHDILICLNGSQNRDDPNRMRYKPKEFYLRSPEEMRSLFSDIPEACDATMEIADRCSLDLIFGKYHLPSFTIPDTYPEKNSDNFLRNLCEKGLIKLYDKITSELQQRLDHELEIIEQMGFAGYFLITSDFVNYAKSQNIPVGPGRGSAAGSLVSYALGITTIDPIKHNLLFERFLNPERISLPDIDIDFCIERRGEVIDYIREKYGEKSVTQIITFGKMKAKQVIRDVGRVMGYSFGEVDKIAKAIPNELNITLESALQKSPDLKKMADGPYNELMEFSLILEGVNRHASTHAAGVVITPGKLTNFSPLYKSSQGDVTSQYDMKGLEDLGLLKMDFLGLRNLTVIDRTIKLIQKQGITIDIEDIQLDDPKVYKMFTKGLTVGIFQFESSGMREFLKKLKPTSIDDLIAMNALYRPGPMKNINEFISRKHGEKKTRYIHPNLKSILEETHGIIVYQEQVMEIANKIAGFSLAEADLMRRAMGKKKKKLMDDISEKFLEGAKTNGIKNYVAKEIFSLIEKFAQYGFNKSHSTAYAYLAYKTGLLKTNYPAEFMSANLTSEMSNINRIVILINECRKLEIKVDSPDINVSAVQFHPVDKKTISYGLNAIKNVGTKALEKITEERNKSGPFKTIFDLCSRVDQRTVNKKVLESLVMAGAMDSLEGTRAQMFESVDLAINYGQKIQNGHNQNQVDMFTGLSSENRFFYEPSLLETSEWNEKDSLQKEKEVLGLYLSGHPLFEFEDELEEFSTFDFSGESKSTVKTSLRIGGTINNIKHHFDRKNNQMAFFDLECLGGKAEILAFSDTFARFNNLINDGEAVFIVGRPTDSEDFSDLKLIAEGIVKLEEARKYFSKHINIKLDPSSVTSEDINKLYEIAQQHQGNCGLVFHYPMNGKTQRILAHNIKVAPNKKFCDTLRKLYGKQNVWIE